MSQHKKKPTPHQSQKLAAAQYRNEFFRKMKHIIDACCGTDIFTQIPQKVLNNAYSCRSAFFNFIVAENSQIPTALLKDNKVVLSQIIKNHKIIIQTSNLEISLADYYTVVLTIITAHSLLDKSDLDDGGRVKNALGIFATDEATNEEANKGMFNILHAFAIYDCDLTKRLVWYRHTLVSPKSMPGPFQNIIEIHAEIPPTIHVEVNDTWRPAIRVGWAVAFEGSSWITMKPSLFNIAGHEADVPLDTYIQSHALLRLSERVDCFMTGLIHFHMYHSLADPKVCYDTHKNILVEYTFFGIKVGYFRVDIINGMVIIRTFLFLTNSSTPEGQLLEKNTGLQKLDKKYLALDKLSTFMNSDIGKNEKVREIFASSGCQCLLDLFEKMSPLVTKKNDKLVADLMLKYIGHKTAEGSSLPKIDGTNVLTQ